MKKNYTAPVLRTVEIGSEAMMTLAVSGGKTTDGFYSAEDENSKTSSPIWDNDSWNAADED